MSGPVVLYVAVVGVNGRALHALGPFRYLDDAWREAREAAGAVDLVADAFEGDEPASVTVLPLQSNFGALLSDVASKLGGA